MEIRITMKTRDGHAHAEGIYNSGKTIVKAGGCVSVDFKGVDKIRIIRDDKSIVDKSGLILCDCEFDNPSSAAQFVNGNISNGYRVWKVEKENLGVYLTRQGLK